MKACRKCGNPRRLTSFYKHPGMPGGRVNICKFCARAAAKLRRNDDVRAKDRERGKTPERRRRVAIYQATHPETTNRVKRQWRQRNPEKVAAHAAVRRAIQVGTLIKKPCRVCGEAKSNAHHADYSKPLNVDWLCSAHHAAEHAAARDRER